ncbi:hypothetical protein [Nitrosococcus wardiae]|uniref:Prenyltransferase n=1 Tax=Nitrosococcus wardiae TaxID=1814290 RepID=A0A4P7BWA3_9GAMM|nr:hypothetical protein [Nitrosococcus wardiae]QBQ53489.1 hypothetical protein E3U44_02460 [Nitrosococcus wardiae]
MAQANSDNRTNEWFVPSFGPLKFRVLIGLLFLPYTSMVLAYTVIGSMLAPTIYWDRVAAILLIYFLALGIGAHALDALGSKNIKPWGHVFSVNQLRALATFSLIAAYGIGIYYMLIHTPLLWLIAIPEGFFVLAYNLEWFKGRFHTDGWFALSWGTLPALGGYILQTNQLSLAALLVGAAMGFLSLVEIKASRPYKALKRAHTLDRGEKDWAQAHTLESILKSISLGVILLGVGMAIWRGWA